MDKKVLGRQFSHFVPPLPVINDRSLTRVRGQGRLPVTTGAFNGILKTGSVPTFKVV